MGAKRVDGRSRQAGTDAGQAVRLARAWLLAVAAAACADSPAHEVAASAPLRNPFGDPLLQATHGLPGCPVPAPPRYSAKAYADEAHDRAQRGTSCWLAGRCRLPNAYLYDVEIVPRVKIALNAGGTPFGDTSVWALGQRRIVWLKGCVARREQVDELLRIVRDIDDVDGVESQLMVGTQGTPPYAVDERDAGGDSAQPARSASSPPADDAAARAGRRIAR
jgi:hypothetical protein